MRKPHQNTKTARIIQDAKMRKLGRLSAFEGRVQEKSNNPKNSTMKTETVGKEKMNIGIN